MRVVVSLMIALPVSAGAAELDAHETTPAALVVLAPGNADAALEARVLAAAQKAMAETSLEITFVASKTIAQCSPTRFLACAASAFDGQPTEVAILASVLPRGKTSAIRVLVIDLPNARAVLAGPRTGADDESSIEGRLEREIYEGDTTEVDPKNAEDLRAYFADMTARLQPVVPRIASLGAIAIDAARPSAEVALDGKVIGALPAGPSIIVRVRPGNRVVRVTEVTGESQERSVVINSGRTGRVALTVEVSNMPAPKEQWQGWRRGVMWSGAAVGAAGVALAVIGVASGGDVRQGCFVRASDPSATCAGIGPPTFGFDSSRAPTSDAERVNPGGVAPLTLGLSLVITGAAWAVGTYAIGDDTDPPWWVVGGGLVLGAAALGISSAVAR